MILCQNLIINFLLFSHWTYLGDIFFTIILLPSLFISIHSTFSDHYFFMRFLCLVYDRLNLHWIRKRLLEFLQICVKIDNLFPIIRLHITLIRWWSRWRCLSSFTIEGRANFFLVILDGWEFFFKGSCQFIWHTLILTIDCNLSQIWTSTWCSNTISTFSVNLEISMRLPSLNSLNSFTMFFFLYYIHLLG